MSRISLSVVWTLQRSQMFSSIYSHPPCVEPFNTQLCQDASLYISCSSCRGVIFHHFCTFLWAPVESQYRNPHVHNPTGFWTFLSAKMHISMRAQIMKWWMNWWEGMLKVPPSAATVWSYFGFLPADSEDPHCMMSVWSASPKRPTENPGGQTLALKVSWWLLSWDNFKVNV